MKQQRQKQIEKQKNSLLQNISQTSIQLQYQPTDLQINKYLQRIQPKKIPQEQFQQLLKIKQNFDRINSIPRVQNISNLEILHAKPFQQMKNPKDSLCFNCYQEVSKRSRLWCRICGQTMCGKCLVRSRKVQQNPDSQQQIKYCEKCDQKYLKATIFKKHLKQEIKRRKALQKIIKQYEMLQNVMAIQRKKMKQSGQQKSNKIYQNLQEINHLKAQRKQLRGQIQEIKNKIQFGRQINSNLKKKLYNLRLDYGDNNVPSSFGTQMQSEVEPPRVETQSEINDSLSIKEHKNINQNMVKNLFEKDKSTNSQIAQQNPLKCNCVIY